MQTVSSLYVACSSVGVLALLKQRHPAASLTRGAGYIELPQQADGAATREEGLALSLRLSVPVFHLLLRQDGHAFRYEHFDGGRSARALQYGIDQPGLWEVAEGEPERWEADAFFAKAKQASHAGESRRSAAEAIWRGSRVASGSYYPVIDARAVVRAVAAHHRLPGW